MSRELAAALWLALLALAAGSPAGGEPEVSAATRSSGTWIAALRSDRLSAETGAAAEESFGGSGELDYLHRFTGGATLSGGLELFRLAEVEWLTARVAGSLPLSTGARGATTTLFGGLEVGPGRSGGASLTYVESRLGLTQRLGERPLFATLEGRYLEVGALGGTRLSATLSAVAAGRHQLAITYGLSPNDELGEDSLILRWDGSWHGRQLFAGAAWGGAQPETSSLDGGRGSSRELFLGIELPGAMRAATLVLTHQELEAASRSSLTLVLRRPRRAGETREEAP